MRAKTLGIGILSSVPSTLPLLEIHLQIQEIIPGLMKALIVGGLTGLLSGMLIKNAKLAFVNVFLSKFFPSSWQQ